MRVKPQLWSRPSSAVTQLLPTRVTAGDGGLHRFRRVLAPAAALVVAAALWWPAVHLFFRAELADYRAPTGVAPKAGALAARHLRIWLGPRFRAHEVQEMRQRNPEWDFMSRTYFVLALANIALRDPAVKPDALEIMDLIIGLTLELELEHGHLYFLLDYAQGQWALQPPRSLFVDGEIALMLAARRLVAERADYAPLLRERVDLMAERLRRSSVLCAESYPDECWLFCNTVALAAIRLSDRLDGTDHRALLADWVTTAKAKLVEPRTGLLISVFDVEGAPLSAGPGPEGTSIWMAAHCLQVVDPAFAADQYGRARRELGRSFLGFGYSREWPAGAAKTAMDVDSGPVIPLLGASASASGLAILGAASFDDHAYLGRLLTALNLAGFPRERDGELQYLASNPVGDAVLLYALVCGPLWQRALAAPAGGATP